MPKGTLKKPKPTTAFEIVSVENQKSPNYDRYLKQIDHFWRSDGGHDILAAAGFVGYIAWERAGLGYRKPRVGEQARTLRYAWVREVGDLRGLTAQDQVEKILREHYSGRLWYTYLKGQRHDYDFYSRVDSIETSLELMEVARVMVS